MRVASPHDETLTRTKSTLGHTTLHYNIRYAAIAEAVSDKVVP
jgi:hypothetical protein